MLALSLLLRSSSSCRDLRRIQTQRMEHQVDIALVNGSDKPHARSEPTIFLADCSGDIFLFAAPVTHSRTLSRISVTRCCCWFISEQTANAARKDQIVSSSASRSSPEVEGLYRDTPNGKLAAYRVDGKRVAR
jgi:hypothetical protein